MNWFKVKLKLKGWFATQWQSDTIFGHLCWGMLYLHGEDRLKSFLTLYDAGTPPLLVSNGFPGDLLPSPITSPYTVDTKLPVHLQRGQFRQRKGAKANRWLTVQEFTRALGGETVLPQAESEPAEKARVTLKTRLNRLTSTTDEGGALYNFEEYHWPEVTIYLKVADTFVDMAQQLFQYVADTGYGKRKSVGYGRIESMCFEPFAGFHLPRNANGFVSLSNFVPARDDPIQGSWNVIIKYGKMGEEWASEDHVFKKPLVMLEAGSTLFDSPCREYYGRLVRALNPAYSQSVQYALALPVPMVIPA